MLYVQCAACVHCTYTRPARPPPLSRAVAIVQFRLLSDISIATLWVGHASKEGESPPNGNLVVHLSADLYQDMLHRYLMYANSPCCKYLRSDQVWTYNIILLTIIRCCDRVRWDLGRQTFRKTQSNLEFSKQGGRGVSGTARSRFSTSKKISRLGGWRGGFNNHSHFSSRFHFGMWKWSFWAS